MSELTIERRFELAAFQSKVVAMSESQAKTELLYLHQAYLDQQDAFKRLLAHQWGITPVVAPENHHAG